jgi:hypothetical protein
MNDRRLGARLIRDALNQTSDALKRRPDPFETVRAAYVWAENIVSAERCVGDYSTKLRRSSLAVAGSIGEPVYYAEDLAAAREALELLDQLGDAFCVSNEAADLRRLFLPDGRWSIREIVDLELIWREIFDADVLPMLLIAEATPARADDQVRIRLADESCVEYQAGAKRPTFKFNHLPEQECYRRRGSAHRRRRLLW